jgi:predicted short-subunit dehydrogenase-like oxidoreductase (DUF2520 family)
MTLPTLGIVGVGKVGRALARLCSHAGYEVRVVYSRNVNHAQALAGHVSAIAVEHLSDVIADLTLLTVPDDRISEVARELAHSNVNGRAFVHTSGAHSMEVLSPLVERRALVGSLHPAYPFADPDRADLTGVMFAVEAESDVLRGWLMDMASAIGGRGFAVPSGQKALYHAALVFASNYTVTLYAIAENLLKELGADEAAARSALNGIVGGTVENLRTKGIPDALTGPLVRADLGTLGAHLDALAEWPELVLVYKTLARLSFPMLEARGIDTRTIDAFLKQDRQNDPFDRP